MVSVREFARLAGCDRKSVYRALEAGRLARGDGDLLDASLADSGWRRARRDAREGPGPSAARPAGASVTTARKAGAPSAPQAEKAHTPGPDKPQAPNPYRDAVAKKEAFTASLREIDYLERIGELVSRTAAERLFFELGRRGRDAWMDWAVREAPMLAAKFDLDADRFFYELRAAVERQCLWLSRMDEDLPPDLAGRSHNRTPGAGVTHGPGQVGDAAQGSPAPAARRLDAGHPAAEGEPSFLTTGERAGAPDGSDARHLINTRSNR